MEYAKAKQIKTSTGDTVEEALAAKVDAVAGKVLSDNNYTTADKNKLDGVAVNATSNDTDANLKNRTNHTGTQAISTVSGLQAALDNKQPLLSLFSLAHFNTNGDSGTVLRGDGTWGAAPVSGIPEAPVDGKQYARKDAAWAEVVGGGGGSSFDPSANQTITGDWKFTKTVERSYPTPSGGTRPVLFSKKVGGSAAVPLLSHHSSGFTAGDPFGNCTDFTTSGMLSSSYSITNGSGTIGTTNGLAWMSGKPDGSLSNSKILFKGTTATLSAGHDSESALGSGVLGTIDIKIGKTTDTATPIIKIEGNAVDQKITVNATEINGLHGENLYTDATKTTTIKAAIAAAGGGGLVDAPSDGKTYGRKDATWTEVVGGFADAPDTVPRSRRNGAWVEALRRDAQSITIGDGTPSIAQVGASFPSVVIGQNAAQSSSQVYNSVVIGANAGGSYKTFDNDVIIGKLSKKGSSGGSQVHIGISAGGDSSGASSVAIGNSSGICTGDQTISVGFNSNFGASGSYNIAIGYQALKNSIVGGDNIGIGKNTFTGSPSSITNSSAFGSSATVSGSNQVQLGNSATTTYAYGAVQDRSDIRDKADIRDTELGLDFILALRPVDYKWDMRDDYRPSEELRPKREDFETEEAYETASIAFSNSCKIENLVHNGSKKRSRYHSGFIAQEVKGVIDAQGVDFGGYQDHSINGGQDVKTIGYAEFIAPLVKAIQEQQSIIASLTARVEALEAN